LKQRSCAQDYFVAVKAGALFPAGALDYSGAALTSPGETTERHRAVAGQRQCLVETNVVALFQIQDSMNDLRGLVNAARRPYFVGIRAASRPRPGGFHEKDRWCL
jgi:hypothetical protein